MAKDILTEDDKAAFKEVAGLLEDRGLRDRFGVYFQHEHFTLAEGEVVHEISDPVGRISLRRAINADQMPRRRLSVGMGAGC